VESTNGCEMLRQQRMEALHLPGAMRAPDLADGLGALPRVNEAIRTPRRLAAPCAIIVAAQRSLHARNSPAFQRGVCRLRGSSAVCRLLRTRGAQEVCILRVDEPHA
jgi:hypothetical protein